MNGEVTDRVQPRACPRDMTLHYRRQSFDHYRASVCNGWEASSCAFRPRVKGVAKLLAQMPTVTARSKPRTKADLSPRWGLGVENQFGPKHCGRPLGGAHHDVGEAVARKRRQRLLEAVVEQVSPKLKQLPGMRTGRGYGLSQTAVAEQQHVTAVLQDSTRATHFIQ